MTKERDRDRGRWMEDEGRGRKERGGKLLEFPAAARRAIRGSSSFFVLPHASGAAGEIPIIPLSSSVTLPIHCSGERRGRGASSRLDTQRHKINTVECQNEIFSGDLFIWSNLMAVTNKTCERAAVCSARRQHSVREK